MDCARLRSLRKPSQACASAGLQACPKNNFTRIFVFETRVLRKCRHRRPSVQRAGAGTNKHPSISRREIFPDTLGTVANVRSASAAQIGSCHPQLCASALCICRVSDMIEMQTRRCTAQIGSYCRRETVFSKLACFARGWRREQTRRRVGPRSGTDPTLSSA
jgi:hypothetical protein